MRQSLMRDHYHDSSCTTVVAVAEPLSMVPSSDQLHACETYPHTSQHLHMGYVAAFSTKHT